MHNKSALTLGLALTSVAAPTLGADNKQPNIVVFLVDDIGTEAVGCYGCEDYKTPNVDQLAQSGMRFTNGYVNPLSSPTRVKLLTGRYNSHNYQKWAYLPDDNNFAKELKQAGYTTAIAGKWQLSHEDPEAYQAPYRHGFDTYCLNNLKIKGTNRYKNPYLVQDGTLLQLDEQAYGPDVINAFALDFIDKNKKKPFLLYYPMLLTHDPFQPTPHSAEYDSLTNFALDDPRFFKDNVEYMDHLVGKTIAHLDQAGLLENTIIFFVGDNGTKSNVYTTCNGKKCRGGKGGTKRSGINVPMIVSWKGQIAPEQVNKNMVEINDFFPTMMELTNIDFDYSSVDGMSFYKQLVGQETTPRKIGFVSYFVKGTFPYKQFAHTNEYKLYSNGDFYHTKKDPNEKNNLKGTELNPKQAKIKAELRAYIDKHMRHLTPEEKAKLAKQQKKKKKKN